MQLLRKKSKELPKIKREDAREKLGKRLSELAQEHNFQYNLMHTRDIALFKKFDCFRNNLI